VHALYKIGYGDSRYTSKLKERLMRNYGDKLKFIPRDGKMKLIYSYWKCNIDKLLAAQMRKL